jgi:hypothetical protein
MVLHSKFFYFLSTFLVQILSDFILFGVLPLLEYIGDRHFVLRGVWESRLSKHFQLFFSKNVRSSLVKVLFIIFVILHSSVSKLLQSQSWFAKKIITLFFWRTFLRCVLRCLSLDKIHVKRVINRFFIWRRSICTFKRWQQFWLLIIIWYYLVKGLI